MAAFSAGKNSKLAPHWPPLWSIAPAHCRWSPRPPCCLPGSWARDPDRRTVGRSALFCSALGRLLCLCFCRDGTSAFTHFILFHSFLFTARGFLLDVHVPDFRLHLINAYLHLRKLCLFCIRSKSSLDLYGKMLKPISPIQLPLWSAVAL